MGGIACELFKTSYVHHNPRKRKPAYAFRVRDDMPWQSNADIFVSQVNHLPRLEQGTLQVWILCQKNDTVSAAHCTCMAGVGEACACVGACLFAVETGIKIMKSRVACRRTMCGCPLISRKFSSSDSGTLTLHHPAAVITSLTALPIQQQRQGQ